MKKADSKIPYHIILHTFPSCYLNSFSFILQTGNRLILLLLNKKKILVNISNITDDFFKEGTNITSRSRISNTVPAPINDAASIQKYFFDPIHYGVFHENTSILTTWGHTKFGKTGLLWAIWKIVFTIQDLSLLARVR